MGFFSWNCNECGHPMLSVYVTNDVNSWMNKVVVVRAKGDTVRGCYDGYGRVDCYEITWDDGCCCYHEACWIKAGEPTKWVESDHADDQGYFFDDEHNMERPL